VREIKEVRKLNGPFILGIIHISRLRQNGQGRQLAKPSSHFAKQRLPTFRTAEIAGRDIRTHGVVAVSTLQLEGCSP
jgi:hypothetical protein